GVAVPNMRPGGLGKDPRFLGAVSDRLERAERLLVEVECGADVPALSCELGETAERQSGPLLVAEFPLDLERLGVSLLRRRDVPGDAVEETVERQGKSLAPGEA